MSIRSTLIGIFVIVGLCVGGLAMANSIFSRDSQMRDAEREFYTAHRDEIRAAATQARLDNDGLDDDEFDDISWDNEVDSKDFTDETPLSLDDWYADAGSNNGAFDPAPEDKSDLINDAEPYSDAEPLGLE